MTGKGVQKPTTNSRNKSQLRRKLTAYTLAGAALAVPGAAKADIINIAVNQTFNAPENYSFYLSGSSTWDVQVGAASFEPLFREVDAFVGSGAQIYESAGLPAALGFGALIDPAETGNWGDGGKMVSHDLSSSETIGEWASSPDAYLGFYFIGSGGPQAGWAHISASADALQSSLTLYEYAYQTESNMPITAGQTASPIPEPSTMALIASGGIGLIALRRRRKI